MNYIGTDNHIATLDFKVVNEAVTVKNLSVVGKKRDYVHMCGASVMVLSTLTQGREA